MTKKELFEALRKMLMEHDFYFRYSDDPAMTRKGQSGEMQIRASLRTCGSVDPEGMTEVINEVLEARGTDEDMIAAMSWVAKWRVKS